MSSKSGNFFEKNKHQHKFNVYSVANSIIENNENIKMKCFSCKSISQPSADRSLLPNLTLLKPQEDKGRSKINNRRNQRWPSLNKCSLLYSRFIYLPHLRASLAYLSILIFIAVVVEGSPTPDNLFASNFSSKSQLELTEDVARMAKIEESDSPHLQTLLRDFWHWRTQDSPEFATMVSACFVLLVNCIHCV